MNHFNFFENAQNESKSVNLTALAGIIFFAAVVVLAGIFGIQKWKLTRAENALGYLESVKNDPAFMKQCAQCAEIESSLSEAEENFAFLRCTEWLDTRGTTVNYELIKTLTSYFPSKSKIIKLTVSGENISIEGVAQNTDILIGIKNELNACTFFGNVFVESARNDSHAEENGADAVTFRCTMNITEEGVYR